MISWGIRDSVSDGYDSVCHCRACPHSPQCGRPAVHHFLVSHQGYLIVFQTCGDHAHPLREAGVVRQEHPFNRGACGLPGFFWDQQANRCVIDDSGVEPDLAGAVPAGASP